MIPAPAAAAKNISSAMANNTDKFYRIVVDNKGIYEVVDRDCPKGDSRRERKPDGSWLPKKGLNYPGAISFWSEYGLGKYRESGLMDWHISVVNGKVEIITINRPDKILHEDKFQIITEPLAAIEISRQSLDEFLRN